MSTQPHSPPKLASYYDVVIAGGGMAGATLAIALAEATDFNILVVEAFAPPAISATTAEQPTGPVYRPSYDARTSSLSRSTAQLYHQLGLWQSIQSRSCPIRTIHVSDAGHFGVSRIHAQQEQVPALGYVVENHWLGAVLLDRLARLPQITWLAPAKVAAASPLDNGMRVQWQTRDGQTGELEARLLVLADGAESATARQLGVAFDVWDYQQTAIVTNATPAQPHQHIAYERFTPTGPLAVLPMYPGHYQAQGDRDNEAGRATEAGHNDRCGIVWTCRTGEEQALLALPEAEFLERLTGKMGGRGSGFSHMGERFTYPLKLALAKEQVRPNLVVMGNAAHALHPVAGQGFNLTARDIGCLVETLRQVPAERIGEFAVLEKYLAKRSDDQRNVIGFADQLVKLFSREQPLVGHVRSLGLIAFDLWPQGKRMLAKRAMGARQRFQIS